LHDRADVTIYYIFLKFFSFTHNIKGVNKSLKKEVLFHTFNLERIFFLNWNKLRNLIYAYVLNFLLFRIRKVDVVSFVVVGHLFRQNVFADLLTFVN
jgi:hypothetical protein